MTKQKTVILFYCGVAVICAAILLTVNFLLLPGIQEKNDESEAFFKKVKIEQKEEWFLIEKDLVATNQAGETVKLSDLRGKVWIVAEFFAICPHCAVRNGAELRSIYDQFKDNPDFHMVCISVDPKTDDMAKLKAYAEAVGADVSDWWFLNAGDEKATHEYLEKTLKFLGVRERTDPAAIEANGRFEHDMGLIGVGRDFKTIGKWDLAYQRSANGTPEGYKELKAQLKERITAELARGSKGL